MSHSIWKGALSFGLIHIPVRVYSASRARELKFKLLHKKDLSEIRYARICKTDGKEIPWEDIVKGYEYKNGEYIVLNEEDFEKANLKKTKTIEILNFTDDDQIDTIYYETPYYLEPEKGAENAYALLREALKTSEKVAIARFVVRHHEHLAVIKPHDNVLILNQLRYHSELIHPKGLNIPKSDSVPKKQLIAARELIEGLSKTFKPAVYADTYTEEIKQVIEKKAKGRRVIIKGKVPKSTKVHDILTLLKTSLEQQKKKTKRTRAA